jgi:hypothetical protein
MKNHFNMYGRELFTNQYDASNNMNTFFKSLFKFNQTRIIFKEVLMKVRMKLRMIRGGLNLALIV